VRKTATCDIVTEFHGAIPGLQFCLNPNSGREKKCEKKKILLEINQWTE
jgi:hypothetical protein